MEGKTQICKKSVGGPNPHYVFSRTLGDAEMVYDGDVGDCVCLLMRGPKVTIKGNAGDEAGVRMLGGELNIEGNAGRSLGYGMSGGKIRCHGDADSLVGLGMYNGKITVDGDAGSSVGAGSHLRSGEIYLNGNFRDIDKRAKAKIYWNDRLVGAPEYAAEMGKIDKYLEKLGE